MKCSVHLLSQKTERAPTVTFNIFWPCGLPMHRGDLSPMSKLQKCNQRRQETTVDQKPVYNCARHHDALAERPLNSHGPQFLPQLYPQMVNKPLKQWRPLPGSNFHNCKMQKRCWQRHRANQRWSQFQTVLENHHPHLYVPSHSPISSPQRSLK